MPCKFALRIQYIAIIAYQAAMHGCKNNIKVYLQKYQPLGTVTFMFKMFVYAYYLFTCEI